MPRYQLTKADCRKGALVANARRAGKASAKSPRFHKLTAEERRRGGIAAAAKRKQQRLMNLLSKAGDAGVSAGPLPVERDSKPSSRGILDPSYLTSGEKLYEALTTSEDAQALEASLASKLMAGEGEGHHHSASGVPLHPLSECRPGRCWTDEPGPDLPKPGESVDPFTLSALKRFRLGPISPFALTRSQRAHVDIMRAGGWVEGTELVSLTEKGRQAIEVET